jgi:hypothetical protein
VTAGLVLVALVLTARFTFRRGPRSGYLLVMVSVGWLLVDKTMEGASLVRALPTTGSPRAIWRASSASAWVSVRRGQTSAGARRTCSLSYVVEQRSVDAYIG